MQTALRLLKDEATDVKMLYLGVCTVIIAGSAMLLPGQVAVPGVIDSLLLLVIGARAISYCRFCVLVAVCMWVLLHA